MVMAGGMQSERQRALANRKAHLAWPQAIRHSLALRATPSMHIQHERAIHLLTTRPRPCWKCMHPDHHAPDSLHRAPLQVVSGPHARESKSPQPDKRQQNRRQSHVQDLHPRVNVDLRHHHAERHLRQHDS